MKRFRDIHNIIQRTIDCAVKGSNKVLQKSHRYGRMFKDGYELDAKNSRVKNKASSTI